MITFLTKISQLDSISEVICLSLQGEMLFRRKSGMFGVIDKELVLWHEIISDLGKPKSAELIFERGQYYLHATDVGFLIIGLKNDKNLEKIRSACDNVREKLVDVHIRKRVLLKMIADADEIAKPNLVNTLMPVADREVARSLLAFLQQLEKLQPQIKERCLLATCKVLEYCSTKEAVPALRNILMKYSTSISQIGQDIKAAAQHALDRLDPGTTSATPALTASLPQQRPVQTPTIAKNHFVEKPVEENYGQEDQGVREMLAKGEKRQAIASLMQLISKYAKARIFPRAEQLRSWILQIDPMALVESIRSAEIIEEEKNASINGNYKAIWQELNATLTPDEASALYHLLIQRQYAEGEVIAKQGEFLSTLFFVEGGRVQINVMNQGHEVSLKVLEPGEIFGSESFFDASVWTVNAVSMGATLSLLSMQKLQSQEEISPSLHLKLQHYCARFPSPSSVFIKTRRSRRRHERKKITGMATIDLLDSEGKAMGFAVKGNLSDISRGGVALRIRFSKKKNATSLLSKKIKIAFRLETSSTTIERLGTVMAVRCHEFVNNDYSLHILFDQELNNSEIFQVIARK